MHACIQVGEYVTTGKSVSRRERDQAFADRFMLMAYSVGQSNVWRVGTTAGKEAC